MVVMNVEIVIKHEVDEEEAEMLNEIGKEAVEEIYVNKKDELIAEIADAMDVEPHEVIDAKVTFEGIGE